MGCIYLAKNLISGKSYVGQTKFSAESRWKEHVRDAFSKSSSSYDLLLSKAIRKYPLDSWRVEVLEECDDNDLDKLEIKYIALKRTYCNDINKGYNLTYGGQLWRHEYRKVVEVSFSTGMTIHTYESASDANRSCNMRADFSKGIYRNGQNQFFMYQDEADKLSCIEIKLKMLDCCPFMISKLSKEGIYICDYISPETAAKELGFNAGNIRSCCIGERKIANGFQWCYTKDLRTRLGEKYVKPPRLTVGVSKYDLDGNFLESFPSLTKAAESINGGDCGHISDCCSLNRMSAYGYQWRFTKDGFSKLEPIVQKRKIICNETGEIFEHIEDASKKLGIANDTILRSIKGNKLRCGFSFSILPCNLAN